MFFEEGALFEQNQCSSGISRMNFVSQTERQRSLEAECQLLHHQLIDTTRTSSQHIAALESENLCLRMELAYAKQFAPRLYMDLPRPHFSSESASSSSSASTQPTSHPWLWWEQTILVWIILISLPDQFLASKASITHQDLLHLKEALTSHNRHDFSSFGKLRVSVSLWVSWGCL